MRLFGQGALTLTATSHTIKCFNHQRGAALSLTQLGYPLSEFLFPALFLFLFYSFGIKITFIFFSMIILLCYLPISLIGITLKKRQPLPTISNVTESSKSLRFALTDPFFPIYVLLSSIPPIMMTAALYFQVDIFNSQGWPIKYIASAIFSYALFKFLSTIFVGPLIDRIGIVTPLTFLTLCIGIATALIHFKGSVFMAYLYYSLYGIGIGASASTMSYLWGLLYGSEHIAQIKGAIAIIRNGGTAISPILFSFFLYAQNIPIFDIFLYSGLFIILLGFVPLIMKQLDQRLSV